MLKKLVFAALAVMFVVAGVYLGSSGIAQGAEQLPLAATAPEDLWVVGTGGLVKVDANTGAKLAPVTAPTLPFSVAIDPQRGLVWVVALNGLFAFDFSGQQVVHTEIPLPSQLKERVSRPKFISEAGEGSSDEGPIAPLVADLQSGDLWLALGPFLYHFDSQGLKLAVYTLPDPVLALALKEDAGALWAATKKSVFRVDVSTGALTTPFDLGQKPKVQTLSLNPESGALWVVLKDEIRRFDSAGQLSLIKALKDVDLIEAVPGGGAWALRKKEFFKLDEAGEGQLQFAQPHDLRPTLSLGTDPRDGSLWALSLKALGHFGTDGQP
jgi:ligand-binding sensor domain-containing protein